MIRLFYLTLILFSGISMAQFTLIHNVNGYTPTREGEVNTFSTLVIKDGKVVRTGDKQLADQYPKARKFNGQGMTLLPGLIDAHGHVIGLGNNLSRLDIRDADSVEEVGKLLAAFSKENPKGWILGRGWDQTRWTPSTFPTAEDLDRFVKDRPVVLTRVDGHAIWVNSQAMALAGINAQSQSPAGGEIIRHASGNPTGVFIDKAESLVRKYIPPTSSAHLSQSLNKAGAHLLSLGITSAHDAGIDKQTWKLYRSRAETQTLPLRIYAMLSAADPQLDSMLQAGVYKDKRDMLSIRSVKIYADGALGSRGAALLKEYKDRQGYRGLMLEQPQHLEQLISQAVRHGFSAHTHAIGDRANRLVLDSYEKVFKTTGGKLLRNRIEHAQIIEPGDIPRFKTLNIIPSMQPIHATSDMHMAEQRLTDEQLQGAYAWQTFLQQGSKVAAGSDFPVELANPFHGLHAAVTRMNAQQSPQQGWRNHERLTRKQALQAFTLDAAYAAFQEFKLGSLEQGKWADFILLDKDYFKVPEKEIRDIQVMQTWIAGQLRYSKD